MLPNLAPITFAVSCRADRQSLASLFKKQGMTMTEEFWSGIRDNVCAWPPFEPILRTGRLHPRGVTTNRHKRLPIRTSKHKLDLPDNCLITIG